MGGSIRACAGVAAILLAALVAGCGNITVTDADGSVPLPGVHGAGTGVHCVDAGASPQPCAAHDGCHQGKAKPCDMASATCAPCPGGDDCDAK